MNLNLTDKELTLLMNAVNQVWWAEEINVPRDKTSLATAKRVERKLKKAQEHIDTEFE